MWTGLAGYGTCAESDCVTCRKVKQRGEEVLTARRQRTRDHCVCLCAQQSPEPASQAAATTMPISQVE